MFNIGTLRKWFKVTMFRITVYLLCSLCSLAYAKSPPPGTGGAATTNVLLMLDVSGSMSTVVPSGDTRYPVDLVHDSKGNVYVARKLDSIEKYDANGSFLLNIGTNSSTGNNGNGNGNGKGNGKGNGNGNGNGNNNTSNGTFNEAYAIDVDTSDNVYVTDNKNGRILKFSSAGTYLSKIDLVKSPAKGLAIDKSNNIYAVNGNGNVEKFNSSGTRLQTWSTSAVEHIAVDASNNVYLTTYGNKKILKYDSSGNLLLTINTTIKPFGIDIAANGDIYVSAIDDSKIYAYTSAGVLIQSWGSNGSSAGKFNSPRGMDFDASGTLWIADYQNFRIQSLTGALKLDISNETRLQQAAKIIKNIVSDSSLTDKVNFGLMTWSTNATMKVNVGTSGASSIYNLMDTISANGSTNMDKAMTLAETYLLGPTSPMDLNATCQKTMLIVISDGEWTDGVASNIAGSLYSNYKVRSFIVGFQAPNDPTYVTLNYENFSKKGGTYPDSPVYADTWQQLNEVIRAYIQTGIDTSLTYSAPTIIPSTSGNDFLIQSTFQYNPNHQWKGHLVKYALNADGSIGSQLWDAGSLLNNVAADSRNIWTVATALPSGLNNFTLANKDRLQPGLDENRGTALTDTELTKLIDFIRGKDSYNEFSGGVDDMGTPILTGERWKLADIYHSRTVIVGAPSALSSGSSAVNSDSYYRYANGYDSFKASALCGVTCSSRPGVVYAGSNDGMLHAFSVATGQELWAFIPPGIMPKFNDMIVSGNKSNSIYGVDGSPTVKDIYYNGQWKTVLMGGLRQGGNAYFALDVTDANNPQHLFSFAFNPLTNKVSYWDSAGTRTDYSAAAAIPTAYNFSALGEAWSQPEILRIKIGGVNKWVAVIAGGYNNAVTANYGTQVYILDMEDGGKILNTLTLADNNSGNGIVNSVPPKVTAVTADNTSLFTAAGAMVYVNDLEGKLWKINLTDSGTLYSQTKLFDVEASDSNDRYTFHETAATVTENGALIQFFGTGNLQGLDRIAGSIANRAYGIIDTNFPNYAAATTLTASSLHNITQSCPTNASTGWYMDFDPNEKITGKATIKNSTLYLPRFTPSASNVCGTGTSRLTEHDFMCGTTKRTTSLGTGIATEAVVYKNHIYIGISDGSSTGSLPQGFSKQGNLIVGGTDSTASGKVTVESWWEDF